MERSVTITEDGRSGHVRYREGPNEITFYWEFGGDDVVAIVNVGTEAEWRAKHAWAVERRAEILRFVGAEVVRQKAPSCTAEVDERSGSILLREAGSSSPAPSISAKNKAEAVAWVRRYSRLRMILGIAVLIVALIAAALFWLKDTVLSIDPGKGSPFGTCVRTDTHIATLVQHLEPYVPSLHRDHAKDRYRMSVFLVPLDGSDPALLPIAGDMEPNSYSLAEILGSDGRTLWMDVRGLYGVRLSDMQLLSAADLVEANPSIHRVWWEDTRGMDINAGRLHVMAPDRSGALEVDPATLKATAVTPQPPTGYPFEPVLSNYMAAGFYTAPARWLGLLTPADLEGNFAPKRWLRPVESASDTKGMRRLFRGTMDPVPSDGYHKILAMTPIGNAEYLDAAFLRMDDTSEPIKLTDPDGALMLHTSVPGVRGTVMLARVDTAGTVLWNVDTGIDRFTLRQVLPGERLTAFVGERPPVPDQVSEPLLVIVENASGELRTHSLWR